MTRLRRAFGLAAAAALLAAQAAAPGFDREEQRARGGLRDG
jgi:hypothetical protein